MEFVYLFIGVLIGAIGGFFVSRTLSASEQDYKKLEQEVSESKSSLEQYQQDVAAHLDSSAKLLTQMNKACQDAMTQMEQSTSLLNNANSNSKGMPFFAAETEADIRSNPVKVKASRPRKQDHLTEAPRDYSADPSGLFNDDKQVVTNSPS